MILTGSGARHASEAVLALAEALDAPVAAFRGGRGVVAEDHPLGASSYAARLLWSKTDVLVGIGSRLELPYMRWAGMMRCIQRPEAPPHLIRVDIDPREFDRLAPEVGIVADATDGARALLEALRRLGPPVTGRRSRAAVAAAKVDARSAIEVVQPQMAYLDAIRAALPRDGFLVPELSQVGFASYFGFPRLRAAHLRLGGLPGHARLRLSHRAGRQGGASGPGGRLRDGRRRLPVRSAGARHRGAGADRARHRALQQRRLRQRAA
jgi:acetolactate synthase-1/2/3 large subunit